MTCPHCGHAATERTARTRTRRLVTEPSPSAPARRVGCRRVFRIPSRKGLPNREIPSLHGHRVGGARRAARRGTGRARGLDHRRDLEGRVPRAGGRQRRGDRDQEHLDAPAGDRRLGALGLEQTRAPRSSARATIAAGDGRCPPASLPCSRTSRRAAVTRARSRRPDLRDRHRRHRRPAAAQRRRRGRSTRSARTGATSRPTARARPAFPTANGNDAFIRKAAARRTPTTTPPTSTGPRAPTPENCGTACAPTASGPCKPAGTITPITSIQTLGANAACNGTTVTIRGIVTGIDDLYGSNYDAIYKADSGHLDPGGRPATRRATTSSALFVAGIRRDAANPPAVIGSRHHDHRPRRDASSARSSIVPAGVGNTSSPAAQEVDLDDRRDDQLDRQRAAGAASCSTRRAAESQDPINRPYYRALQGMRVQLPGGHRDRRRHDEVPRRVRRARAPTPSACSARTTPAADDHAVVGRARRARHRARRRRRQPGRPAPAVAQRDAGRPRPVRRRPRRRRPAELQLQLLQDHAAARAAPRRRRSSAARSTPRTRPPPRRPPRTRCAWRASTSRTCSRSARTTTATSITQAEYDERVHAIVLAIRNLLKEPDVIAVQEVAVFADGANALTGLAAALGNYTGYIATNNDGRGIATGFLVKNGTTATNGERDRRGRRRARGAAPACATCTRARCSTARRTSSTSRRATCRSSR